MYPFKTTHAITRTACILLGVMGIISCRPITGNLTVSKPMALVNRQYEQVHLKGGTYPSKILWEKKDSSIELRFTDDDGLKQKVRFHVPEHLSFPEKSGTIKVPSSENDQPWDLTVTVTSVSTDSKRFWGYEPCYTHRCIRPYYKRFDGRYYWEDGICYGEKQVEYYYRDTVTDLDVQLTEPGTDQVMGVFKGQSRERGRIYTFEGPCY